MGENGANKRWPHKEAGLFCPILRLPLMILKHQMLQTQP